LSRKKYNKGKKMRCKVDTYNGGIREASRIMAKEWEEETKKPWSANAIRATFRRLLGSFRPTKPKIIESIPPPEGKYDVIMPIARMVFVLG